jgi:hypothetical protein
MDQQLFEQMYQGQAPWDTGKLTRCQELLELA